MLIAADGTRLSAAGSRRYNCALRVTTKVIAAGDSIPSLRLWVSGHASMLDGERRTCFGQPNWRVLVPASKTLFFYALVKTSAGPVGSSNDRQRRGGGVAAGVCRERPLCRSVERVGAAMPCLFALPERHGGRSLQKSNGSGTPPATADRFRAFPTEIRTARSGEQLLDHLAAVGDLHRATAAAGERGLQ